VCCWFAEVFNGKWENSLVLFGRPIRAKFRSQTHSTRMRSENATEKFIQTTRSKCTCVAVKWTVQGGWLGAPCSSLVLGLWSAPQKFYFKGRLGKPVWDLCISIHVTKGLCRASDHDRGYGSTSSLYVPLREQERISHTTPCNRLSSALRWDKKLAFPNTGIYKPHKLPPFPHPNNFVVAASSNSFCDVIGPELLYIK
jgi:hypothetical protein